jgi:hypothetical protein
VDGWSAEPELRAEKRAIEVPIRGYEQPMRIWQLG